MIGTPENSKFLLGEVLLSRGLITQPQLEQALKIQKEHKGFLGKHLIKLGFLEERDVVVALIVQCNIPYIAIDKYNIERNVLNLIPNAFARDNHVIPLDRVGDILSIVMADPLDVAVKAEVQRLTQCRIAPFIATENEIIKAIERSYV